MLSVFWFLVFLLIIWSCFYHAFIEDDGRLQQYIILTTLMISAFLARNRTNNIYQATKTV